MTQNIPNITEARRLVIKTGSALVTDEETGLPHSGWMASLAADIADLRAQGKAVILVSSGAVSLGRKILGLKEKSALRLDEKQAAAACGQVALMDAWRLQFSRYGLPVGQILLTLDNSEHRSRFLNARQTLETLLELGVIPIVNENDTVATAELKFGDNDRLAARVAEMAGADNLIILSDIDGFYTADPSKDPTATRMATIETITPAIEKMAGGSGSSVGSGGMITKVMAAKIAQGAGCHTLIAAGKPERPISQVISQGGGTWFIASSTPITARKRWINGSLKATGTLTVDDGAATALTQGKSLLAAGVVQVDGEFERGEAVQIISRTGQRLGKGLVAYNSGEAQALKGKRSEEFEALIGYKGRSALIHRDDLVLEGI